MTDQQHILRAEHDADQGGEDGYMEVVARISGDPRSYPISVPEDVIDSVIDLYMRLWGVNPDRIYRLKGNVPADLDEGYVEPRELIWPDYAFEWPDPPVFSPPDFLDRLELQKELRAEREPATFDPSDPENMATEQLIERIEELEESRKILLSQRARLASTNDALQDELNLASQAAQKDAMASGRQQITLSRQLADAGVAADHAHQIACERENELERTNGTLSAQIACLEKENADGKANRSQQAAQILALDDACKRWEERAQAIKLEAALAEIGRSGAEAGLDAAEKLNRAIGALNDVHGYCDQLENYLPKKARKRMEKECGNYWADKLLFVLPEPVQFTGFPPLIPNGATGQGGTLLGPVSFNVSVLGANVFLYLTLAEVAAVRDQCNKVVFELGSGRTT